jgi:folate-binding protein YgfZ
MSQNLSSAPGLDGALRLSDWGLIRARGADARAVLNGQLTQDVLHLPVGQARLAGYCSPKGRLLASFLVWPLADDDVLLACSADLLPATLKRLSMFVLRARCRLSDASAEWALYGLAGSAVAQAGGASAIRLPDARLDGQPVPRALLCQTADQPPPQAPALDPGAWLALEALSGVPRIVAATAEQFVPQMVNLELVGGVSFGKGCYPGQEVVARSQYRGTLKRRGFVIESALPLQPGQEIFHSADPGQPAGQVVLAGRLPGLPPADRHFGLAELKLDAVGDGTLHLARADGPRVSVGELPYPLPQTPQEEG